MDGLDVRQNSQPRQRSFFFLMGERAGEKIRALRVLLSLPGKFRVGVLFIRYLVSTFFGDTLFRVNGAKHRLEFLSVMHN